MKKLFIVFAVFLLTACGKSESINYTDQIVITDNTIQATSAALPLNSAPASAAPASSAPENSIMLEAQKVNEYIVDIEVDPENRRIKGVQKVKYTNTSDTALNSIYFNLYLNAFDINVLSKPYFQQFEKKIFERGREYGFINVVKMIINNEDATYTIDGIMMRVLLAEPLVPGAQIEMTMNFEAFIPKISHRTGANDNAMWCGNFLPVLAVYDSKGWHIDKYYPAGDPFFNEIANYTVNITTPLDYVVVGTGLEKTSEKDNKKVTAVTASMVRDFAFAVSKKYNVTTVTTKQGVDINFYYYSNIPELYYYLVWAQKSIEYFSDIIGSYPYQTLDIVECEMFFECGMEYSQIVFMDSSYLQKKASYKTIVHEMAHQWFYNIVGSDQVSSAWLDEGFAAFLQDMYIKGAELDTHMKTEYENLKQNINKIANPRLSGHIAIYDKWSDYYNVHYVRAKLMLYSLYKKIGEENFMNFIKAYYGKYCFSIVYKEGLISTAEEIYGESLAEFFSSWINNKELPPL